jgi:orotidine-5'-phosphate decarboxylase
MKAHQGLNSTTTRGIILACDVGDIDALKQLVTAVDTVKGITGYKFGSLLTLRYGLKAVARALRRITAKTLIYDHQKAGLDIPSMGSEFAAACRDSGVDALVLFPLGGPRVVEAFVGGALKAGLTPIVGGALPLEDYVIRGGGYVSGTALARISRLAFDVGARDFVIPATDAAAIRSHCRTFEGAETRLFMPGIGALGGEIQTSLGLAKGKPCFAIIGRAIYAAPNPRKAATRFAKEALSFT